MEFRPTVELKNYFSTPLWWDIYSDFLHLDKVCDKYIIKNTNEFVYHSSNVLLKDNNFNEFTNLITIKSNEFLNLQGFDLSNHRTYFQEMWVQEFNSKGGGNHNTHIHWNSHVSGFYFLKCSDKTSYPVFHDPRPGAMMSKLPLQDNSKITHGSDSIHFKIKPGTMILFNSYLPHEFVVDKGLEPFRFIHWNIQMIPNEVLK
jgi:uncharacterized protein (TIGR02466 family)